MQPFAPLIASLLLVGATLRTPSWSQTVYRCGNTYGQTPCLGAIAIDVSDSRTPAQKAQADAAAAQTARSADKLEHERKALEHAQAVKPAGRPSPPNHGGGSHAEPTRSKPDAKKKGPDYFIAVVPVDPARPKKAGQKTVEKAPITSAEKPVKQ